ncbi:tetratricopeptide repeat protein [Luteimonas gilva]|uniref:Tetratricopeptide repeat protein n=1 Tax=Luteimonas gilva TaxID=2572684 RepID=A0A4U5JLS4_9GAMM|nr:tetratricopeptide repeat protein [Luteimonas gilva]TKR30464.1 tetratricopeptide repeat protein [Luteimonas gilva]
MKRGLFSELKRRNVIRAAVLYVGAVWALAQGIAQLAPLFGDYDWVARWFVIAGIVGFPFWVAFAWFYEFTPEGLKRESEIDPADAAAHRAGRKWDFAIIGVLSVAVVLLLTDRFVLRHGVNAAAEAAAPERSIAVLPFANLSSDKDQAYFSDGISEELLNLLAKNPQLQVTARTSSFAFKGKDVGIPEIARRLRVAHVLEGSVQKAGNQVRITVQLVDARSDRQLWSRTWDRRLDDIFKIQDEIAGEVVKELKVKLLGASPKARATDPQAYARYLQARELGRQLNAEALAKSDALYQQALAIDPRYAPAWEGLAANFVSKTTIAVLPNQEGLARAREAYGKALSIDPDYGPAYAGLGFIAMYGDNDLATAAQRFERALALDPTNLGVLNNAADLLRNLGRLDEALAIEEAIVGRDPVDVRWLYVLGYSQRCAGRYDAAIASYRTVLSLSPDNGSAHYQLSVVLLLKGDAEAALAEIEQETNDAYRMIGLPMAYYALGRKTDSDQALSALIAKYQKDAPYNIAGVYAYLGEPDKAFEWLDKAVEYQDPGLAGIVSDDLLTKIHADPRWLPFLRKRGKAPEQLAKIEFKVPLPKAEGAASGAAPG